MQNVYNPGYNFKIPLIQVLAINYYV